MVPQTLMDHPIPEFLHQNCFTPQTGPVKVYYHRNDYPIGMHMHSFYEINLVVSGTGRHYIEDHSCDAHAGCVFVLPPKIRHGYWEEHELSIFHILLSCAFMEQYQEQLRSLPGYPVLFEIEPMLRSAQRADLFLTLTDIQQAQLRPELDALDALEQCAYAGAPVIKSARTLAVIGTLCRWVSETHRTVGPGRDRCSLAMMESMEYIHRNLAEKLTVDALAQRAHMSRSTYLRSFRQISRSSPIQYQLACRLARVKELLTCTDDSITQIAQNCGFYDESQLARYFSRAEQQTPRAYRRSCLDLPAASTEESGFTLSDGVNGRPAMRIGRK